MNETAIIGRQVELLYRNVPLGQAISIINAALLAWLWHAATGTGPALAWFSAVTLVALGRLYLARTFSSVREPSPARWLRAARIGAAASGFAWAAGALLFTLTGDTTQLVFTAFVMAGMVAGAVPVLAADRLAFRLYSWPIVIACMAGGMENDPLHIAYTVMALLFLMIATRSAKHFHDTLQETLRLEQEKSTLLEDLQVAKIAAEASDRAKSHFLSNISHELRTPMSGIIGMADLLEMENLPPAHQQLLRPLKASADELLGKIENMIELSALEVGDFSPRPVPFSLPDALAGLVGNYAEEAHDKGLRFSLHQDATLPPIVIGDLDALRKILRHLTDNAIKFTAQGEVAVEALPLTGPSNDCWIEFLVRDSGPGIAPDHQAAMFGLFNQGDNSSTRRHGGTGIGLPISRRLAQALGGTLTIQSQPGVGTTARVALPFALAEA